MRNKYKSKKVVTQQGIFDSTGEHRRFLELQLAEDEAFISKLERQVKFILQESFTDRTSGKKIREVYYKADFVYYCNRSNKWIIEDFKGFETQTFKLKKKMLLKLISDGAFDTMYPRCIFYMSRLK